ncbi:hypothetical protein E4U55_004365 [Claviceps digitariae]|nr:hypothetical protein E4U55_004365 [Claviceps digitariae]
MATYGESIRGDGLINAHRALLRLEEDPLRLDRERSRFSRSPPPYTSDPESQTATRSPTPLDAAEEERFREQKRRDKLSRNRLASMPDTQFTQQAVEMAKELWRARNKPGVTVPVGWDPSTIATAAVRQLWIEQGIWKEEGENRWDRGPAGVWKHEEPLEPDSESEPDPEAPLSPQYSYPFGPFGGRVPAPPPPKLEQPKTEEDLRRTADRRAVRERQREASRPYHQFVFQVSKEREKLMQQESESGQDPTTATTASINTRAYDNVKRTWTKRGIWYSKWGILPGMSWKHEGPVDYEEAVDDDDDDDDESREFGGAIIVPRFGSEFDSPSRHPLINALLQTLNSFEPQRGAPDPFQPQRGAYNPFQPQRRPADMESAELENRVEVEHPPSQPASSPRRAEEVVGHPAAEPVTLPPPFPRQRQTSPMRSHGQRTDASLGPIHSSRVAKPAQKRKSPRRPSRNLRDVALNGSPSQASGVQAAEPQVSPPPTLATPRRSKRLQASVQRLAQESVKNAAGNSAGNPAKTVDAVPPKRTTRSKPERKTATSPSARAFAKPQGVPKRQAAKAKRGKAKKNGSK